jgi:hypothetical protein
MIKVCSVMKKKYIKPVSDIVIINHTAGILAVSYAGTSADEQLAPSMINIPEEESHSEHEE